ncbi:aromatase/cyclase [Streptomyces sp. CBMA123]|uniref:aromatase/cyclase n=1 Tax=Streptomyces sp. CBMA123 TaxID=1896313 RepID=UPI00294FF4F3|nr:aromatase/cyclase [Streptomyces sp. CBMA123]
MSGERRLLRTEHTRVVRAAPETLYDLAADVTLWPAVFGPSVHVHHLERGPGFERFELWALVNGAVSSWVSRRALDPERRSISFEQERSRAPIASMGGEWLFRDLGDGRTEVVLRHHFTAVDDDAATIDWITEALDRNSPEELAALARITETGHPLRDLVFSFVDTLPLDGGPEAAYRFVDRADLWAERLPHVARVVLAEPAPGVQELEMDTVTADGSAHTTRSVRVCREPEWIAYKQLLPPQLLFGHSGLWTFGTGPDGPVATARHTVAVNPGAVEPVLGAGRTVADAREYVREALGRNSLTTLSYATRRVARS